MRVFQVFNRFVTSRTALVLALFVVLALLIWIGGPMIAVDGIEPLVGRTHRLIAIAVLAALFLGLEAFRRWRLRRLNRRILSGLYSDDGVSEPDDRTGRIREGHSMVCEALRAHAGARFRDRRHLYEQPWYLLLGEAGSGRTTALVRSGLEFVLDIGLFKPSTGQGRGSTGECGWWVTDEAVFVVAPGDFVTELGPAQAAEWDDLLSCLKSARRRHPLNGILLAIPATSLTDESAVTELTVQMRRRLREAMTRLRMTLPVYLLITKCDQMAGFSQYFSSLHAEERTRPFGVMLPLAKPRPLFGRSHEMGSFPSGTMPRASALAAFDERFGAFTAELAAWTRARLEAEREEGRRRRIFGFPQQMQALRAPLEAVVRRLFGPSRFHRQAVFRGVFFASACQRGRTTDQVMQAHRDAWNLQLPPPAEHDPGQSSSFFLGELFRDVIVSERELAERDPHSRRHRLLVAGGAYALIGTTAFAFGASLWLGSVDAERRAGDFSRALAAYETARTAVTGNDFIQAALSVAPLRTESRADSGVGGGPGDDTGVGSALLHGAQRLGTNTGRTMLRIPAELSGQMDSAYAAAAHALVRPAVVEEIGDEVQRLAGAGESSIDRLRELLAVYLGLSETARFDAAALREWAGRHVHGQLPLSPETQTLVVAVVGDAFDGLDTPLPIRTSVVASARGRLRVPPGKQIHERMKDDANALPGISIDGTLDPRTAWVFAKSAPGTPDPSVPGYFSEPGYYEQFLPGAPGAIRAYRRDDWMAGDEAAAISDEQLFADLGALYARDYIAAWREFLDGIVLRRAATTEQASRLMEALLSNDSPLDGLVRMVAEHTELPVVRGSKRRDGDAGAADSEDAMRDALNDGAQAAVVQQYGMWPGDRVHRAFAAYHTLRDDRTGDLPGLSALHSRLGALHTVIVAVDTDSEPEAAAFGEMRRWIELPRESEIGALRRASMAQPAALRRMLVNLGDQTIAILMRSARRHLDEHWQDSVFDECRRSIAGRYPIDREAEVAIAPGDFESFFAANGAIDRFFTEWIRPFVDTTGARWKERDMHGHAMGFRDDALAMFRSAITIRDAFGLDTARLGDARFTIEPVYLDSNALRVSVETSHETFSYRHEPPRRFRMKLAEEAVSISMTDRTGVSRVSRASTAWAWFRVFDRFRLEPAGVPDLLDFTAEIGGLEARFRISADRTTNPLAVGTLTRFRCEERLL